MSKYYIDRVPHDLADLLGKTVKRIFMSQEYLQFHTNEGTFTYTVEGGCCSHSYFYDFHGVKKLLAGNPVVSVRSIPMEVLSDEDAWAFVKAYGFEIVTEDPTYGEVTSVFSFRNDSNGFYGGWMKRTNSAPADLKELTDEELGLEQ